MYLINEFDIVDVSEETKLIVNLLSGAADFINSDILALIMNRDFENIEPGILKALRERNYIFGSDVEYIEFVNILNQKLINDEKNQIPNFLLIPTYSCNLNCSYCYEKSYDIKNEFTSDLTSEELAAKMIGTIDEICNNFKQTSGITFGNNDVDITFMGGEPLYSKNYELLAELFDMLRAENYNILVITNGYELNQYIPILKNHKVNFIQVTIDGTRDIHDSRRFDKLGNGTFDKIIENIELALKNGMNIYIRTNVDSENINDLPELANILLQLKNKYETIYPYIYILQDGACAGNKLIIDEVESLEKIFDLEKTYPQMSVFKKTFHGIKFIESILKNTQFEARLSNCAACRNQYILDADGDIYKCWFGVGNELFKIGEYIPKLNIREELDNNWKNRNITTIKKCISCKYRYMCGGGCASRTKIDSKGIRQERCADFNRILNGYFLQQIDSETTYV